MTPNKPLVGLSCHNLTFAPLNINYDGLVDDLREAGLDQQTNNLWDAPLLISNAEVERQIFQLQPDRDFDLGMFPVTSVLMTPLVPLPENYSNVCQEKTDHVLTWEEELSKLDQNQLDFLLPLVQKKYDVFLEGSSNMISNIECDELQ